MSIREGTSERLARLGYAARGAVYVIVGGLAVLAALGTGGGTTDTRGALYTVLSQPFGWFLLGAVALGLLCFAAWRVAQALLDADHLGTQWRALGRRIGFAGSAAANGLLAVTAIAILAGTAGGARDGEGSTRDWTAYLLSAPFGQWLVGAVGLLVVGIGIGVGVRGWRGGFEEHLALDGSQRRWVIPLGRLGFLARALVFVVVGGFLLVAAVQADPGEARGLAGALRALQAQPYGWALLGATAFGLFAFGAFQFAVARYRRIDAPDLGDGLARMGRQAKAAVQRL
jgi:hypothetical protein